MSELYTIAIYCHDSSHDQPELVDVFADGAQFAQAGRPRWVLLQRAGGKQQFLKDSDYVPWLQVPDYDEDDPYRRRYKLRCQVCGWSLERSSEGPVQAALDKLAAAGVTQISLAGFAANI